MRLINADDVLDIVDDLRDRMTVEGYWSMIERVKALPSAHPEPCEDVISRAEAIRVASGYCHPANIAKELEKLPSAQPERKTGRWSIEFSPAYMGGAYCECSQCNCTFAMGAYFEPDEWKFCPNCGARMEGENADHN